MAQAAGQAALREDDTESAPAPPTSPSPDALASAPFDGPLATEVRAIVARLSQQQRLWLSGYLAGSVARDAGAAAASPALVATTPLTILFGSQSGNSEALARQLAQRLAAVNQPHRLLDMLDCRRADLEQARRLAVIVSTHGDGDPPERAAPFFELLAGRRAPRLEHTRFSVLALGDSSYEHFCAAGRKVEARLVELGAKIELPRVDCDVDFEAAATTWMDSVAARLADGHGTAGSPTITVAAPAARLWTRKSPFQAELLANEPLTARGSTKDVRHVEISLGDSGIQYEPGDALGIVPRNAEVEVRALLEQLAFPADAPVQVGEREMSLHESLGDHLEIGAPGAAFARRYAEATRHPELLRLVGDEAALQAWLHGRDLRDLVAEFPPSMLDAATFARLLAPLAPRLYSIASSQRSTPDEVHLTIGVVAHEARGRRRQGVVSGAVAALAGGATLPVYLHRNAGFRLPADPATPIVMIGAGTGVAPYRAFLAEREACGATGRNWLVFGDRCFETDFLYQAEWLAWRRAGLLTRLDVAFSRDQAHKIHVQHRLRENGAELWRWLQRGACLYVCGDASRMAPDVERALLEIARDAGGLGPDAARDYLRQLQRERRYQKDVY